MQYTEEGLSALGKGLNQAVKLTSVHLDFSKYFHCNLR